MSLNALKKALLALSLNATLLISSFGQSTCVACNETSGNFDEASGLCLPSAISGLESVKFPDHGIAALKAHRNTVVTGYNNATNRLAITVYLYDRDSAVVDADLTEIRSVVTEILSVRKGAKLEGSGRGLLPLSGQATETAFGFFLWREGETDYASFLWLIPRDKRYLKFRATYVRPIGGETEAMASAFETVKRVATEICVAR